MFQYTTIHRLRQEDFTQSELSDAAAVRLIREASGILSDVCGQWFNPVRSQNYLDGSGEIFVFFPNKIPILEVINLQQRHTGHASRKWEYPSRVEILREPDEVSVFNPTDFYVRGRYLELNYSAFYPGRGNVEIDAYTGWLDSFGSRNKAQRRVEHTTVSDFSHQAVEVELDLVDGLKVRDYVIFEKNDTTREVLAEAIINSIDRSGKKIQFNKIETLNEADVLTGSKIITFGAVPELIERATIMVIKRLNVKINSDDAAEQAFASKIKTEKTDRYSYTLFGDAEGGGIGLTGDPIVDRQLSYYAEPQLNVDIV